MSPAPRKNTQKASPSGTGKANSAAEVEKQASEKAAESVPKAEDAPAPQEETSDAAAAEASAEEASAGEGGRGGERSETGSKTPARKPRAKKAEQAPKADAAAEDDEGPAAEEKPKRGKKADEAPKAEESKPARKRDQPRKRQPGEAPVLVSAKARYVRTSARKARLVCDHIRGKDVEQARAILSFTPRGAAKPWMKLLESAIANAEHNHELVGDELKIASVHADEGPSLKRYRPRAMGRATRIRKRTSHLSITLTPKE
jgi:ribosomal protein L22